MLILFNLIFKQLNKHDIMFKTFKYKNNFKKYFFIYDLT